MPFNPLDLFTSAIQRAVGLLASLLGGFGTAIGAAITGVVAGLGGLSAALKVTTGEASALARSLSQMRASSGYSFRQGYDIQRRFGAIGISQSDTAGLFSQQGNSSFGFASRGVNPRDLAGLAAQYQGTANSGIFGRQLANSRLDSQFGGSVPAALREALSNLSPNQIRGAQGYSDRINGSLGINPSVLKEYVTTLPLVQAKIGSVVDAIKIRFATEALPLIENVLSRVADYLAANADKIAATIRKVSTWLVFELPIALLRFAANAAGAFGRFLEGVAAFTRGVMEHLPEILTFADGFINAVRAVGTAVAGVAGVIRNVLQNIGVLAPTTPAAGAAGAATQGAAATVSAAAPEGAPSGGGGIAAFARGIWNSITYVPKKIGQFIAGKVPGIPVIGPLLGRIGNAFEGSVGAFKEGAAGFAGAFPTSNLAGNSSLQDKIKGFLGGAANGAEGSAGMLGRLEKGANGMADSWQSEMLKTMKGIEQRTAGTEKNTGKDASRESMQEMADLIMKFGSRVASFIAEDNALNLLKI